MFNKVFTTNYHPRLLKMLVEFSLMGAFAANIIAPFISLYLLFDFLPHMFIYLFVILNLVIFSLRIFTSNKLSYYIDIKEAKKIKKSLKIILVLIFFTSSQYIFLFWVSILQNVSDLYILILGVMLISLAAGAISTLSSVFTAFLIYVLFTMIPLFCFSLYLGGIVFNTFSIIIFIFLFIIISAGYRQFSLLKNSVSLEDTFKTIFEKSPDGIIIIKNSSFKDCNEAILKMIGCETKDDFLSLDITTLSPQFQPDGRESKEKAQELMQEAFEDGFNSFEWLHKRYNGEEFWAEIILTKIILNEENLLHVVMRDISERKKKDAMLLELNSNLETKVKSAVDEIQQKDELLENQHSLAQMGEMLSMIAHQWRQPLAAISATNSSMILKTHLKKLDDKQILAQTSKIQTYISHLSETIDDFRDFFKPDTGMGTTNYDELISSILGIVESSLKDKSIELMIELECKDTFMTYSNEMKQVILNLIKNAEDILVEKSIEKPYIKIKTYKKNGKCIFEIRDNGGGISKEVKDKIFNPYFSTKTKKNGTGLGLYMSKKIVEDHCAGKIDVSNGPDGAIFRIILGDK